MSLASGSFPSWVELRAKDREGLTRVALEIDLVQRPRTGRLDARTFGRRALGHGMSRGGRALAWLPWLR